MLHVVECVFGDLSVERLAAGLRAGQIRQYQLRLVVEHLLEVRHAPLCVHRIPVKSAGQVIVNPAERHRAECLGHHLASLGFAGERPPVQQEQQFGGTRKLRCPPKSPVASVVGGGKSLHTLQHRINTGHRRPRRPACVRRGAQLCEGLPRVLPDLRRV